MFSTNFTKGLATGCFRFHSYSFLFIHIKLAGKTHINGSSR